MNKIVLLILFTLRASFALTIFDENGNLTPEYYAMDFREGETPKNGKIKLDDGREFLFLDFLGAGNTTNILKVQDPKNHQIFALRLPIRNDRYIRYTLQTYPILQNYSVTIPELFSAIDAKYVLNEVIDFDFDMDFFFENFSSQNISQETKEEAQKALLNFSRQTAMFAEISDFNATQLVYSTKRKSWILLDWSNQAILFNKNKEDSLFSEKYLFVESNPNEFSEEANNFLDKIKNDIQATRSLFLKEDEDFFRDLTLLPSKEKILKAKDYLWKSHNFKEAFRQHFLIDHIDILNQMSFSANDIQEIKKSFKFIDAEAVPLLKLQLQLVTNKDQFISMLKEDSFVFKFNKKDLLVELKDHFYKLGGSEAEISALQEFFSTNNGACFKRIDSF